LEREANDPDSPIAFDKELNEFNFEYSTAGTERKAQWRIYHCPFCGGAAPESKRRALFASISDAEERRLRAFCRGFANSRGCDQSSRCARSR
jgi:hypothetical protein